jgi:zinc/manganese transport system substrate-binding protein
VSRTAGPPATGRSRYGSVRGPILGLVLAVGLAPTACSSGTTHPSGTSGGKLLVVAAENFWGSIASQLGGDRVSVTSIISSPDADPHDYEPTASDARLLASAAYVIVDGIGYDSWTQDLLDANPVSGRDTLDVGDLVGVPVGGNPHQWYSPTSVRKVIDAVTAEYAKRDPANASYFEARKKRYLTVGLKGYFDLIARIKSGFDGTPVGASESIFAELAPALGLNLTTPPSFLRAISEGAEPTAADKAAIDQQIRTRSIEVYVYNSQNATPDIQRQVAACRAEGIPVTTITETLVPQGATFQGWQVQQLTELLAALQRAAG